MSESKEKEDVLSTSSSSPKVSTKKTKYQAFRSEDEDSSDGEVAADKLSSGNRSKLKKEKSTTFKVKIKSMKGKKKEKSEKKKKTKKSNVLSGDENDEPVIINDPVFGVPLEIAVERSMLSDKIPIPRVVRDCIHHIEKNGITTEGLYRVSGIKSKVDQLKVMYDEGQDVDLGEVDPCASSSLLKLYLRELPSSVLTTRLAPIFDSCVGLEREDEKVERYHKLINDLPLSNRTLLAWLFTHFQNVMQKGSENKMSIQNLTIVFSPTMSISHGVLNIFFEHTQEFFPDTRLIKPPVIEHDDEGFPMDLDGLHAMYEENEKILAKLHSKVNQGCEDEVVMEELWERQRKSTQIKRKIKVQSKRKATEETIASSTTADVINLPGTEELKESKEEDKNIISSQEMLNEENEKPCVENVPQQQHQQKNHNEVIQPLPQSPSVPSPNSRRQCLKSGTPTSSQSSFDGSKEEMDKAPKHTWKAELVVESTMQPEKPMRMFSDPLHKELPENPIRTFSDSRTMERPQVSKPVVAKTMSDFPRPSENIATDETANDAQVVLSEDETVNDCVFNDSSEQIEEENNCEDAIVEEEVAEGNEDDIEELLRMEQQLVFENEELGKVSKRLKEMIQGEKHEIKKVKETLSTTSDYKAVSKEDENSSASEKSSSDNEDSHLQNSEDEVKDLEEMELLLVDLEKKNKQLKHIGSDLISKISEERNLCAKLKSQIRIYEYFEKW